MKMNKSDYIFQIATYHRGEMEKQGYGSYTDLKKLNVKQLKNMFGGLLR